MSEENIVEVNPEEAGKSAADTSKMVSDKISEYSGKVDGWVEKAFGLVGDHPWDAWLKTANRYITMFLPAVVALAGLLSLMTGLVSMIRQDAPFSMVIKQFWIVIPVLFSMHLAPKALALSRSFIEKGESDVIRPELMYIMKVVFGVGGILLGVYLIFQFCSDLVAPAICSIIFALLMIICLQRPEVVGVKAGYPVNSVEEIIALIMFPIRVVLALMTLVIGLATVGGIVYGIVLWFDNGMEAMLILGGTSLFPFLIPLAVYLAYLVLVFLFDFYRAIVSIPRKLDELKK